jgi:hypothetical protein
MHALQDVAVQRIRVEFRARGDEIVDTWSVAFPGLSQKDIDRAGGRRCRVSDELGDQKYRRSY